MDQFVGQRAGKAVVTGGIVWGGLALAERLRRAKPIPVVVATLLGLVVGPVLAGFHPAWSVGAALAAALVFATIAAFLFRKPARPVALLAKDDRLGLGSFIEAWYRPYDAEMGDFCALFDNGVYRAVFAPYEVKPAMELLQTGGLPRSRFEGAFHVRNIISLEPKVKDGQVDVRVNYREPYYDEPFELGFKSVDEWDDFRDLMEHRCKVVCRPGKVHAGLWRDVETPIAATGIYFVLVAGFLWIEWNAVHGPPFRKPAADFRLMVAIALAGLLGLFGWIVVKARNRTMIDAWTTVDWPS
jgi:hypothetical protein